jgi:hypothetical protein
VYFTGKLKEGSMAPEEDGRRRNRRNWLSGSEKESVKTTTMWGDLVQFLAVGAGGDHGSAPGGLGLVRGGRSRWGDGEVGAAVLGSSQRKRRRRKGVVAAREGGEERGG